MSVTRCLLVDHNTQTRRQLRSAIESLGPDFQVDDVRSGEEALLEFMRQPVDVLVVGLSLLGMSGLELTERLRARKPDLRVIALAGNATRDLERKAEKLGIETILPASVDASRFLAAFEDLLGIAEEVVAAPPQEDAPDPEVAEAPEKAAPPQSESASPLIPTEELTRPSLSVPLSRLRQHLNAVSVTLMNDHGRVLAQAGDYPALDTGAPLTSTLLTAFSTGNNVIKHLGGGVPENIFSFSAENQRIFLRSLQNAFALVVVLPAHPPIDWGTLLDSTQQTAEVLLGVFGDLGLLPEEVLPGLPQTGSLDSSLLEELAQPDETLDALFQEAPSRLQTQDVDAFWNTLSSEEVTPGTGALSIADALSYEEALRLGLVPGEEDESS